MPPKAGATRKVLIKLSTERSQPIYYGRRIGTTSEFEFSNVNDNKGLQREHAYTFLFPFLQSLQYAHIHMKEQKKLQNLFQRMLLGILRVAEENGNLRTCHEKFVGAIKGIILLAFH
jgi:hypothetical protein